MSAPGLVRGRSLRRHLVYIGAGYVVALAVVMLLGIHLSATMQADLRRATTGYLEEQRIADSLVSAVNRQLLASAVFPTLREDGLPEEFRHAGDDAYRAMRRYLFRDLSPDERLQLEMVKEEHQSMEVAASEVFQLLGRDDVHAAEDATTAAIHHSLALQAATSQFLRMRERDLERLGQHQTRVFDALLAEAGLAMLLLLVGTLVAMHYIYHRIAAPLNDLATAAARVGAGDLSTRVPMPHHGELAAVAESFNGMASRLARNQADLEYRNEQLGDALTRLRDTQDELVQTEKLSAMGRMMAGLAHEISNPLASVLGFSEILDSYLDEHGAPEAEALRNDFLTPIVSEARRARELIQDLLVFVRRTESAPRPVSVDAALQGVKSIRGYAFSQAGLELRIEGERGLVVRADAQHLQQVFLNVVLNALDAMTPLGRGTLRVRPRRDGANVVIEFCDEGPGLSHPDRIFEPFFTTKPVGKGTGLGLALVHRFVSDFGGSVSARNYERGAIIAVTLPATSPAADSLTDPEEALPPASPDRPRVLVVEDEAPLRELQRRLLTRLDAEVHVAASAAEARELLARVDVDLVISDVKMPGESGLDLYRWIERERPELRDRFLFVTGDVGDPEIASLAERRPDRFVRKPFQIREYTARVSAVLDA